MRRILFAALAMMLFVPALTACQQGVQGTSTPPATTSAATQTIVIGEPGSSAQYPGLFVMLRRAVWKDNRLDTYWLLQNNGNKRIGFSTFVFTLAAYDDTDKGGATLDVSPEWDETEQAMETLGDELLPGQTAVDFHSWQFSPSSKGVQILVSYLYEGKLYQARWNVGP